MGKSSFNAMGSWSVLPPVKTGMNTAAGAAGIMHTPFMKCEGEKILALAAPAVTWTQGFSKAAGSCLLTSLKKDVDHSWSFKGKTACVVLSLALTGNTNVNAKQNNMVDNSTRMA